METIFDEVRAGSYQNGETVFCESVGEYTLPDYLPEIRKLLRIDTKLLPTGQFAGTGKAEFMGIAVHTLLYSDENGKLASAVLNGDYRFAVPVTAENDVQIMASSRIDRVSHRLSGPRRIGIRTGIASDVRIAAEEGVRMANTQEEGVTYEKLQGSDKVSDCCRLFIDELRYTDVYRLDGIRADAVRPIASDASVFVKDCRVQQEGVYCAGEVWVKFLYGTGDSQNELIETIFRKIPFDTVLPVERAIDHAVVTGKCTSLDASVSDDGLGSCEVCFDLQLMLEGEGGAERELSYVKDAYAHGRNCRVQRETLPAFRFLGAVTQNFTVSGSSAQESLHAGTRVIDCAVTLTPLSITWEDGKVRATGEGKAEGILLIPALDEEAPRYERTEFVFPIRLELDGKQFSENARYRYTAEFLGGQMRLDGENLRMDGELALTLSVIEDRAVSVVADIALTDGEGDTPEGRQPIIVAYPDSGETLWSLAKRYKTDISALVARNHIPDRYLSEPDAPSSIDGVMSLIIA